MEHLGFGSRRTTALISSSGCQRINLVLVVIFILREWSHFGRKLSSSGAEQTPLVTRRQGAPSQPRAVAGSAHGTPSGGAHAAAERGSSRSRTMELEAKYRREGRRREL